MAGLLAPNPNQQTGGMTGMLRDLLTASSPGHSNNRMANVRADRMRDMGMAPEQLDYEKSQREKELQARQKEQWDFQDRQRAEDAAKKKAEKVNTTQAYVDYARREMKGGRQAMGINSWLSLDPKDRSELMMTGAGGADGGYSEYAKRAQSSGQRVLGQQEYNALSTSDRSELIMGGNTGGGGGYNLVSKGGYFEGTEEDFNEMTDTDRSALIKMAGTPQGFTDEKAMRAEYDMSKYTKESVANALKYGDELLLMPIEKAFKISPERLKAETESRKEYQKEMEPIRDVQENHAKLMLALGDASGAGDMTAIFQYMKALDPRSVVRENEFKMAAQVAGIKEGWLNIYNRFSTGGVLPEKARRDLANLSRQLVDITRQSRDKIREEYTYRSERYEMDKRSVMGNSQYDYDAIPEYSGPTNTGAGGGVPATDLDDYLGDPTE